MRNILFLLILCLFAFTCEEEQQTDDKQESSLIKKVDNKQKNQTKLENTEDEFQPEKLVLFKSLSKSNEEVYKMIIKLEQAIKTSDTINNDYGLLHLLSLRDSLHAVIRKSELFDTIYDDERNPNDQFRKEAEYLGFNELWAEGFYYGLDKGEFMEELFEEKASEPLKLRTRILNLLSYTSETEYPYLSLSEERYIIYIGEQMIAKYPEHKYTLEIQKHFERALCTLFDFHAIIEDIGWDKMYINFGIDIEMYPGWTNLSEREAFIKDYPKSKYVLPLKKVLSNLSVIDKTKDSLYIVSLPNDSLSFMDYLEKGLDVPHVIYTTGETGSNPEPFSAYRFYSDKTKAEEALKLISKKIPGSKIVAQKINKSN